MMDVCGRVWAQFSSTIHQGSTGGWERVHHIHWGVAPEVGPGEVHPLGALLRGIPCRIICHQASWQVRSALRLRPIVKNYHLVSWCWEMPFTEKPMKLYCTFSPSSRVQHLVLADPWGFPERPLDVGDRYKFPLWVKAVGTLLQPFNPLFIIRTAGPWGKLSHLVQ